MKFRIRFAHQIVGAFILLGILAIAAILILMGVNQRWFAKNYYYWSTFPSAEGLGVGMAIKLKGFEIGKVDTITLTRTNAVDVEFYVYDTYHTKVTPNSVLELASSPLGLGAGLLFHPGKGAGDPLPELSFVPSLALDQGKELVRKGLVDIPQTEDLIAGTIVQLGATLVEIDKTIKVISETMGTIDASLKGESAGPLAVTLNETAVAVRKINGVLDDVEAVVANLDAMTAEFRDPTGLATRLLDPKGSVATILDDDNQLYDQVSGSIDRLNAIIAQLVDFTEYINSSQPQIAGLLEKGRTTLDEGKDVLEAVKNNPLLRGGVPERREQPTTFQSFRDEEF
ncbi:MAG: MCE family protein [Spirochaetales bacterium]|nr:MCE family protein [Spirochaetales bacterium]